MNYHLNEYYKYVNSPKLFMLKDVSGYRFNFYCGHWCTDNVFLDLVRVKTNIQVYEDLQLPLF